MTSDARVYQNQIRERLARLYRGIDVENEWRSRFDGDIYSPRLDIAVGPFAIREGERMENIYDELMVRSKVFIDSIIKTHLDNMERVVESEDIERQFSKMFEANRNARCFIAVEIENTTSEKHIIGGAVNAASLGRIGLLIGFDDAFESILRMKRYLDCIRRDKLNIFDPLNLIILSDDQLGLAVDSAIDSSVRPYI